MAFQVLGLDHVVFRVRDIEAAVAFYRDVLGCDLERALEEFGLYQMRAGRALIDLVPLESKLGRMGGSGPGNEGRNVDHVCLRIEPFDPEALEAHLRAHGVSPSEVAERYGAEGMGPSVYLEDPDGNTIELKGPPSG